MENIQHGVLIINDKPPVWSEVCKAFNIVPRDVIFAYCDRIYNPYDLTLPEYLIEHEKVHFKQQGGTEESTRVWWDKFLSDSQFRISQELEAYAHQYKKMCIAIKDRNKQAVILHDLARSASGPLYNNMIGHSEAMKIIKEKSLTKII
jgi:hypothetical protein